MAESHNLFEPSLAPPDGHLWQFLRFLTPEQMADRAKVARAADLFLQRLEAIWPDARGKLALRRTLVRPMLTAASHRHDQPAPSLLPVSPGEPAGLFLAGDAVNAPGELSAPAGASALASADLALRYLQAGGAGRPAPGLRTRAPLPRRPAAAVAV